MWQLLIRLVLFLNTRMLPAQAQLDPQAIVATLKSAWAWCQSYLQERDPGVYQYRGLPLHPKAQSTSSPQSWTYRGCNVQPTSRSTQPVVPAVSYTPWYQHWLRRWFTNRGFSDVDRLKTTLDLRRDYRGQSF